MMRSAGPAFLRNGFRREGGGLIVKGVFLLLLAAAVFGGGAYFTYKLFLEPAEALQDEKDFGTPTPPPDQTLPEYAHCLQLKKDRRWLEARKAYESFIENYPASTKFEAAKDDLGAVNIAMYFSASPSPEKDAYVIRKGDSLVAIEKRVKAPGDLIMRANNLTDPRRLRVGDTLYVPHPEFTVLIDRKARLATLYNHGLYFKQYHPVAWNAPAARNPVPLAGKVSEIVSTHNGQRVSFGSRDYENSIHLVQISVAGFSFYTDPAEGGPKEASGVVLSASDMDELSSLLTRGVPVTIR